MASPPRRRPRPGRRSHWTPYNRESWKSSKPGSLRDRAYRRDGFRCQAHRVGLPQCLRLGKQAGGDAVLTLDHLIPAVVMERMGREPRLHEVLTLCRSCHGKKDGQRRYNPDGTMRRYR